MCSDYDNELSHKNKKRLFFVSFLCSPINMDNETCR